MAITEIIVCGFMGSVILNNIIGIGLFLRNEQ